MTLVLTLCLMVGLTQFAMGLARLGALVNFISHTVIVGFTAGAALLIIAAQLRHFFGVPLADGGSFYTTLRRFGQSLDGIDPAVTATGVVTLAAAIASRRLLPRIPYMIVAMVAGSVFGFALTHATGAEIRVVGPLPSSLPPLSLPSFASACTTCSRTLGADATLHCSMRVEAARSAAAACASAAASSPRSSSTSVWPATTRSPSTTGTRSARPVIVDPISTFAGARTRPDTTTVCARRVGATTWVSTTGPARRQTTAAAATASAGTSTAAARRDNRGRPMTARIIP